MKRRPVSMQKILSSYFLLITTILLILATIIFSIVQYTYLRSNAIRDIQRTCTAIGEDIDLQLRQMDTICLNTIYSSTIKDAFASYLSTPSEQSYERSQYRELLSDALAAAKGIDSSIRQINLYSIKGGGYGYGNYTGNLDVEASGQPWYGQAVAAHGYRYILPAATDEQLSVRTGTSRDRYYLSLYRMYYDDYRNPVGFVEAKKYYDVLFDQAFHPSSNYHLTVAVYDAGGNLLFPLSEDSSGLYSYYDRKDSGLTNFYNPNSRQQEYACYSEMTYSDFTVVTAVVQSEFLAPVYRSLIWTVFVFFLLFLLCLFCSSLLSRKLSNPLKTIYHFLSHIDSENQFQEIRMADTGIIEIDKLRNSLNEAMRFQKSATDSMMLLKEQEVQAQMLALQSQMNPHFLYNSLSTIAAMAEEGMTRPVTQMCLNITSILRYISSNREQLSTLEEELEHCDLYLSCMKLRFGGALNYTFDVEDDMLELPIPKLCIQLLVENAIKFTASATPPWNILIRGSLTETSWYVEVRDNGPGFDDAVSSTLRRQMEEIRRNGILPSLKLDGMGILNIFIRFYLIYGNSFYFDFGTLPEGGATITIGGSRND